MDKEFNIHSEIEGLSSTAISILANHTEVRDGVLFMLGGGFDRVYVAPDTDGPWAVSLSVAIRLSLEWGLVGKDNLISVKLFDFDGAPVRVKTGDGKFNGVVSESRFNITRAEGTDAGEATTINFAHNFFGIPFEKLGRYVFVTSLNGEVLNRTTFRVERDPKRMQKP